MVEPSDWVRTKKREGVALRQIIPKLFDPNGLLCFSVCPQQRDQLPERSNAGVFAINGTSGLRQNTADNLVEARLVHQTVHHESRQSFAGVENDVSPLQGRFSRV